ncbi:8-amino-7-oxononanoate synthase [Thiofaba sp. EF100]|uniref:8-amino-7-oxononanoate synthase n=1 Tax=Thiofaba sp. EF100 TaxID=3121274 RepID=UPI0032221F4E
MKDQRLRQRLAERHAAHLYRRPRMAEGPSTPHRVVDGRPVLSFCSNDYLGLASHPQVIAAFKQGAEQYGVGSGAAHLVNGHTRAHQALEEELADFVGRERALLFSTGYMANLGVIGALVGRGDAVFEDRLNHASLLDGGLLSGARFKRYPHADANALAGLLAESGAGERLVVTDGVFSMDGDLAPLPALATLAHQHDAWLMVDDAHGLGVLGARGRGTVEHFGLGAMEVPVLMGTLGKALGTAGAFVAGDADLIEWLIQAARPYIYTTAMPAALAEATRASLHLVDEEPWRREHLRTLITRFRAGAEQLGLRLMPSDTPIQPILVGDAGEALGLSQRLWDAGIQVTAIRPPTVPQGTARLRVTFSAAHSLQDLDILLTALCKFRNLWHSSPSGGEPCKSIE